MLSPYPEHYRKRVSEIETELRDDPPQGRTVVLMGDSITESHPVKKLAGMRVINQGISGDEVRHSAGGLMRRLHLVPDAKPAYVFILIGINDLVAAQKTTDAISADQAELIMKLVKSLPTATVYAQTILPVRDTYQKYNESIRALNLVLTNSAARLGARILDLHAVMADETGALKQEFSADGLHINSAAYEAWTQALDQRLKSPK
jgi:lysophospholipase L1-like esterase